MKTKNSRGFNSKLTIPPELTNLTLRIYKRGRLVDVLDLGPGLTTNVGALALANDSNWPVTNAQCGLFRALKYHSSGTSATAAAATDIKLNSPITGATTNVVAGTQVLVSAANSQKWQTVATINYDTGGPYTVQEWGLFAFNSVLPATTTLSDASMSPFTAGSATTGTTTGTMTASSTSSMGQACSIADNTNATRVSWGVVTGNTTTVVTVPAWYKTADGTAGTAPVNADTMVFRPIMWDHRQFTSIGVSNGDSIQFTYTLTINSGG